MATFAKKNFFTAHGAGEGEGIYIPDSPFLASLFNHYRPVGAYGMRFITLFGLSRPVVFLKDL